MQKEHDERAKLIAEQALDRLGEVQRELEIPATDALRFDLYLQRRPLTGELPSYLSLLSALFDSDCMLEIFSRAVSLDDFWDGQLKQLAWRRQQQRRLKAQPEPTPVVPPARVWILSAERPDALFAQHELHARQGLPAGIYEVGHVLHIGLVVIAELPVRRDTLLLRLMGSVAVCEEALRELGGIEDADPDASELRRLFAHVRHTLSRATNVVDEEREEIMTASWAEFERYEQDLVQKSEEKGLKKGAQALREAIVDLCEVWGIELSDERRAQMEAMDLDRLRSLKDQLKRTRAWAG